MNGKASSPYLSCDILETALESGHIELADYLLSIRSAPSVPPVAGKIFLAALKGGHVSLATSLLERFGRAELAKVPPTSHLLLRFRNFI